MKRPRGLRASGALCLFAGMIKIIGKEFSVCTAQAELVVNPRLGLRGELAPYMFPAVTDQEEIGFPIICHGVLPSAALRLTDRSACGLRPAPLGIRE